MALNHQLFITRFGPEDNTWEPKENLDCSELIEAFEKARREKTSKKVGDKRKLPGGDGKSKIRKDGDERPRGFDRGLDPERIIGATDSSGELMFLIKVLHLYPSIRSLWGR